MIIGHNLIALKMNNQLNITNSKKSKSIEKLSSGLRINRASDDSAGLSISEGMKSQIRGLEQAQRNIQDGTSLVQVADGGLAEIQDSLQRMRELSVKASNDILTDDDRKEIQQEINQLKSGIDDISNNTEFNSIRLLNGSLCGYSYSSVPTTKIQTPATNSKCIANVYIPSSFDVVTGYNDKLSFDLDGVNTLITINAGAYNSTTLIDEINSKLSSNIPTINATSTYEFGSLEVKNDTSGSQHTINNLSGSLIDSLSIKTTNGYVSPLNFYSATKLDFDYSGSSYPYSSAYNPYVNIQAGINDTLTFKLDGVLQSITIPPDNYYINFDDGCISSQPITSEFINNINASFNSANIPVEAYFMYAVGDISTADYGTSLYFRIKPSTAGVHTLGEFGGNAKSEIFNEFYINGWTHQDSSTIVSETATDYPATLLGNKDLSSGVNIDNSNNILNLDVNGINQSITLANKYYTPSELLNELNNKLEGVTASYSGDKLLLTNQTTGNASTLTNISGNSINTLFENISSIAGIDTVYKTAIQKTPDTSKACNLQIGANTKETFSITIDNCSSIRLGLDDIHLDTQENSQESISKVDNAISKISSERSKCGAYQNTLLYTLNNVNNYTANLTTAESRITDADIAKESMSFAKESILEQVIKSLFSQAQQIPQNILQLIK